MPGTLYEQILNEHKKLDKQINSLESQIKNLPDGKLVGARNGKYYRWYHSDGHVKNHIPKENQKLIEQLAKKEFLTLLSNDLSNEKKALALYLNKHASYEEKAANLLEKKPMYKKYISSVFKPLSEELDQWMNAPYERSEYKPEQLICKTAVGSYVRSKSENLIDMKLRENKIPFRYECPLKLGDTIFYPDFTIRHPRTGELYYWEHFGMMDKSSYARNAFSKLDVYVSNNIIPSINLITTFETHNKPLQPDMVENMIKFYFL